MNPLIIKMITNDSYNVPLSRFDSSIFTDILHGYKIDRRTIKTFIQDTDILLLASESVNPFDEDLINKADNVKYISIDTTDFVWIDTEYAKKKGITISNNPHISTEAVAEHIMAFMLNFAKKIHHAYRDLYIHNRKMTLRVGSELKGKTLGIIGFGNIGTRLAEIATAFGMHVIFWNRTKKTFTNMPSVELMNLLQNSDYISLNLALNNETKNFLDEKKLSHLKKGVYIVNLANKELVDIKALAPKIISGEVAGYGLEFWEIEEADEHVIYGHENVIAFNGFGWYTKEALERTFRGWVGNVEQYLKGNIINKIK